MGRRRDHRLFAPGIRDEALRLTNGRGVDLVIESVGGDVLRQSIDAVCFNGRLVTCGAHAGEEVPLNVIELFPST